jgi:hypothetical protein
LLSKCRWNRPSSLHLPLANVVKALTQRIKTSLKKGTLAKEEGGIEAYIQRQPAISLLTSTFHSEMAGISLKIAEQFLHKPEQSAKNKDHYHSKMKRKTQEDNENKHVLGKKAATCPVMVTIG